ncbi:MAG: chemotaxis protein CheB [Gemmatimonadaceae bacterium]|nr:chemotaxis protein CheB [Gloeobacterales cyanobacterium ES-bin-141]
MPCRDIIVIGASAGGVEALSQLIGSLPADLPAALFVVLHVPTHGKSAMPKILNRSGPLLASHPKDGEAIVHGHVYVAPPDYHLLVKHDHIALVRGPRENSHRPAIDPLFRSAARAYGRRVVGVVLSGLLDDGTAGLLTIKEHGGTALVQDPDDALFTGMPRSAIENVKVDSVLSLSGLASELVRLAYEPVEEIDSVSDLKFETDIVQVDLSLPNSKRPGTLSGFGCPDCGGTLWEINDGQMLRFRCRTGHAYSVDSLLAEQSDALEEALWTALRALEENAALARRLAERARARNYTRTAERFDLQVREAEQRVEAVRRLLLEGTLTRTPPTRNEPPTLELE